MFGIEIWKWFAATVVCGILSAIPGIGVLFAIPGIGCAAVVALWVLKLMFVGNGSYGDRYPGTTGHDRALRNRDKNF